MLMMAACLSRPECLILSIEELTVNANQTHQLAIDRSREGLWTVTINDPPINMLDKQTIDELQIPCHR
jgi:hypothetical protein